MDVNVLELENIILTVFEVFIFYVACSLLFNKRPYRKITKYSIIFVFLVAYVYVCLYSEVLLSKVLLGLLILCIMLNLLFYNGKSFINSVLSVVMVVIIVLSFNALLDYMLLVFMKSLTNEEIYSIAMGNPENLFTIGLLSRFILLALVVFITKHKKGKVRLSYRYTISFVFVFFLTVVSSILSIIPDVSYNFLFFIIMANTILMYYILNDFVKMSETVRVKSINEERYKNELNFWHEMKEKDTVQRKMLHDYSETLLCIRGYLDEKKFDEQQFIRDLASCRFAIVNGGHTTLSEALFYGKPVLCFPVKNQTEQEINAQYLAHFGYGEYYQIDGKDEVPDFSSFLKNEEKYRKKVEKEHCACGNRELVDVVLEYLAGEQE